ncbi:RNA-binding protein [Desulfobotulus alkaliphilus]|uniref:RNA-binding protein n=1 Tax=Desulfobotulus alkaliphilus TaxID=622671 RepID=A0A562S203_9BACT|nr:ribosome assembly RNA-binding protein YhbY [Desulfobotulus alkaliphilus]TWI75339.1 RNA-binding protein [Desulfobotulus alkaliphilus]
MTELKGFQKQYLKGLAHSMKPVVIIGQHGVTPPLLASIEEALHAHELIKVRFNDFKEKEVKDTLTLEIVEKSKAVLVSSVGHTITLYRPCKITEKRKIRIPKNPVKAPPA